MALAKACAVLTSEGTGVDKCLPEYGETLIYFYDDTCQANKAPKLCSDSDRCGEESCENKLSCGFGADGAYYCPAGSVYFHDKS